MKILTDYEKGFIEASIDTDGSILLYNAKVKITKKGWSPRIILVFYNNSIQFLDKIQKILGTSKNYIKKKSNISKNINYELRYHHADCRCILPQLRLVIKEKRRILALEILEFIKHGTNQYTITPEYKKRILEFGKKIDLI